MPFNSFSSIQHLGEPFPLSGTAMLNSTSEVPVELAIKSQEFRSWLAYQIAQLQATATIAPYFPTAPIASWTLLVPFATQDVPTYPSALAETHFEEYLSLEEFQVEYMKKYHPSWQELYNLVVSYQQLCHRIMQAIHQPQGHRHVR